MCEENRTSEGEQTGIWCCLGWPSGCERPTAMSESILGHPSPQKNSISKLFFNGGVTKEQPPSPDTELNGGQCLASSLEEGESGFIARQLGDDYIGYKVGKTKNRRPPCLHAETLRRVGDEVEERYAITLNGLVNNLEYDPEKDGEEAFTASLNAMFEEGACNWGRVVMVYVFAARLAKYCQEHGKGYHVGKLADFAGRYVATRLTPWINKQGGWDNFNESFKAKDWKEKAAFNSLLVTGAFLGGLAALRLLMK
ncbi:bcl-2-like protein 2 [Diadema antillarum]|uniref:bcl-2-like protein 2 n=1 Tax=Diadema antillarum TaxID=105358 RepID=UPI003A8AB615